MRHYLRRCAALDSGPIDSSWVQEVLEFLVVELLNFASRWHLVLVRITLDCCDCEHLRKRLIG